MVQITLRAELGRVLFGVLSSIQAHSGMELGDVPAEVLVTLGGNSS